MRQIQYGLLFLLLFLQLTELAAQSGFDKQRKQMVNTQLKTRDITDRRTIDAMSAVPREQFVPKDLRIYSYSDGPLPIGEGQTISQPYIVAYMTQSLRLRPGSNVLEIGTGSGYQAAVLAEIVDTVYSIEIVRPLAVKARNLLKSLGYHNVQLRIGDGYNGWPDKGPFDAIIVTAGAETIPQPLLDQLAEGGRMMIPVGPHGGVRQLIRVDKKNGKIRKRAVMAVRFVPLTREE